MTKTELKVGELTVVVEQRAFGQVGPAGTLGFNSNDEHRWGVVHLDGKQLTFEQARNLAHCLLALTGGT